MFTLRDFEITVEVDNYLDCPLSGEIEAVTVRLDVLDNGDDELGQLPEPELDTLEVIGINYNKVNVPTQTSTKVANFLADHDELIDYIAEAADNFIKEDEANSYLERLITELDD